MKILIIGGDGYIGSRLYRTLKGSYIVESVDIGLFGSNGYSYVCNYDAWDISKYTHIVLLAAHSSVNMCEYSPKNAWRNNVDYFYNLCSKLTKEQTLIYASSSSVYGNGEKVFTEEDINLNPINYYDLTKINNDIIANKFISEGKSIVGLRFGTLSGESDNIRSDLMINSMYYSSVVMGSDIVVKNPYIYRPILGMNDCVNSIKKIIDSPIVSGQFNLNSFNSNVFKISNTLKDIFNVNIKNIPDDPKHLQYNFRVSNLKFSTTYEYEFTDTIYSIADELVNTKKQQYAKRNDDRLFNSYI